MMKYKHPGVRFVRLFSARFLSSSLFHAFPNITVSLVIFICVWGKAMWKKTRHGLRDAGSNFLLDKYQICFA